MNTFIVSGAAGFIGASVSSSLLDQGHRVIGIDNLNHYYNVNLKKYRLGALQKRPGFRFVQSDISSVDFWTNIDDVPDGAFIIHLAAQAGVRHSLTHPSEYIESNLTGFGNILEFARRIQTPHFVYASTSSVYGLNSQQPFNEKQPTRHPLNLYAATKIANEAMAHAYSHLFGIPSTGLRFFTVYGPAGRPDMAPMIFARKLLNREQISLFSHGENLRDFTFIDDIVDGIVRVCQLPSSGQDSAVTQPLQADESSAPFRIFNIGSGLPISVSMFLKLLGEALDCSPSVISMPGQAGDMESTHAETSALREYCGWKPKFSIDSGVHLFAKWCLDNRSLLY